jgi:hypothetical protein
MGALPYPIPANRKKISTRKKANKDDVSKSTKFG